MSESGSATGGAETLALAGKNCTVSAPSPSFAMRSPHGLKAPTKTGEFDQAYMQALYEYGYQQGRSGHAWHKVPPGLAQQPAGPTF